MPRESQGEGSMSIARAKGPRGKADVLFSKIIRSAGVCRRCGETEYAKLQTAHILSRRYSATRTDTSAAICLCWTCHRFFTDNPVEWTDWLDITIGRAEYLRLKMKAQEPRKFGKQFWEAEIVRLKALLKEAA